ncbi:unnamed protein product [Camellia sinensis]
MWEGAKLGCDGGDGIAMAVRLDCRLGGCRRGGHGRSEAVEVVAGDDCGDDCGHSYGRCHESNMFREGLMQQYLGERNRTMFTDGFISFCFL